MKVLVTGCAGFIGSNIVERLLSDGHFVVGIDNFETGHKENIGEFLENENFKFIEGDIRNLDFLDTVIKEYSIKQISHQAARGSVPKSVEDPIKTNSINVIGTLNVLFSAKQNNVEKVVVAISSSIYGDTPELPKKESMHYNPKSPYAITKVAKDLYGKNFFELYGLKTIGLRYFNVYGYKQDPSGAYAAVIPKFILSTLRNNPMEIYGDGNQTRDFTFVKDVVDSNILALEKNVGGISVNIAYGSFVTINQLAKK
ncbi:putative NAD-dependent epimerase/dehydratase (WbpP) (fragment) [groundwater metagenome]|uniref:Putative NAD-dependent epimerase/dehydratase (WbpP) n=1 Tax=groundwater metagenome TaxID=717931 RepID=A0A098EFP9_9ZZZZ